MTATAWRAHGIVVSPAEMEFIQQGMTRTVSVPVRKPRKGATAPKVHIVQGREYKLCSPPGELRHKDGREVRAYAVAVAYEKGDDVIRVTFSVRIGAEVVRVLAASPGGEDGDYTSALSRGVAEEPEPVDEAEYERRHRTGWSAEELRVRYENRAEAEGLRRAIEGLEARSYRTPEDDKWLWRHRRRLADLARRV